MAKRVASSSVMSLLSAVESSSSMSDAASTCIASTRWPPRVHESVAADLGGGSYYCEMRDATARRRP
eukprot:1875914-Pleurochrysis_carterae.AAC.1